MKQKRAKIGFTGCAKAYIRSLQEEGRYSTAHVYKNAVLSFTRFHGSTYIAFEQITRESLRRYGQYLYDCKLKLNTISTYMECCAVFTIVVWKLVSPVLSPDCFVMYIPVWMSGRKRQYP